MGGKNSKAVQQAADAKRAGQRGRNWMAIGYPESMPEDWRDYLATLGVRVVVSPLHCDDINATGESKKPHHHILFMFDSVKSPDQVKEIADYLNSPVPMKQDSAVGAARYLCHLDNPEKAQYEICDVIEFGGADYLSLINRISDKYRLIAEMMDWCDEQGQYSFAALMRFSRSENEEWFRALCDNAGWAMKEYMKSAYWEIDSDEKLQNQKKRHEQMN